MPDDFLKGAIFLGIRPRAAALEPARGALAGVRNPLGKLLVYQLAELLRVARNKISGTLREHAVSREATLAVLGLRLHRAIDGTPAPSLQALVDKRLLPRLPQDPWSGDPLRYSAAEEKVWSVGANRIDDGGRGNEEAGADGDVVFGVR